MAGRKDTRADLVTAFAFSRWAVTQSRPPSWQQIQGVLQCSSATARRWRRLWLKSLTTELPTAVGGNLHH